MLKSASKLTINTGNVLNLIDIKKAGQNVTEELSESIKLTLSEWGTQNGTANHNGTHIEEDKPSQSSKPLVLDALELSITRPRDDSHIKMAEEERKNLRIGVKIFINVDSTSAIIECLDSVFSALHADSVDNVILAYNPEMPVQEQPLSPVHNQKASPISLGPSFGKISNNAAETDVDTENDRAKCEALLPGIKILWQVLEDYVKKGRVGQLGVADIGGGCLRKLHSWAHVRPTIAQINLASCCVVPPSLHEFCRANDVQLLTHADPPDLLTVAANKGLDGAGVGCQKLDWCARYQVHIKCRGVLALKGYVCKASVGPA